MPEIPGPSVFTPFFRRFTDERARDLSELRALHQQVRALHYASPYCKEDAVYKVGGDIYSKCADLYPDDLLTPIAGLLSAITRLERTIFEFPEIKWDIAHFTLKEQVDLNRFLTAKQYFHAHEDRVIAEFKEGLEALFQVLTYGVPTTLGPSPFNVPIMNTLNEPRLLIDRLYNIVCSEKNVGIGLFAELRERTYANICKVSNVVPHTEHKHPLKHAMDSKEPFNELVDTYLAGTPFIEYLHAPIPLKLTYEDRFSHMHILGGSGAGKTQLLQHLILHDLQSENPPSLVIVDSQGDLIDKLSHLALFDPDHGALASRLVLISPKDIKYRQQDLGVTRLFLPEKLAEHFTLIHDMESALRDLVKKYPEGKFAILYISSPLQATRRAVLDPNSLVAYVAGESINPRYPLRKKGSEANTKWIDDRLKHIGEKEGGVTTTIDELLELVKRCPADSESGAVLWDLKTIKTAMETIKELLGNKAYLVVRRGRRAEARRGERKGILSGGEESLAKKDAPTLFLYRQEATDEGEPPVWWPQLRFPEGERNYVLSFSTDKNGKEEEDTDQ